jgi:purine-binding chemotaxis protein CheW
MDISKIRKKALAKDAEKEQEKEKSPVSGPAEDKKNETEVVPGPVEESAVFQEKIPDEEATGTEEDQAVSLVDEDLPDENTEELVELLTFSLFQEEYAFRVSEVEEIIRLQNITGVPSLPDYVCGITSLRGKIIPVIDLSTRLNLQGKPLSENRTFDAPETETIIKDEKKILVIEGKKGLMGAIIDKVIGVVRLPLDQILQPPGHLNENELKFIEGIVVLEKRFISIIYSGVAMDIETS